MKTETKSGGIQRFRLREGLMVLGVLGALAVVPGCFVDSGPGPGPAAICGDGFIQAEWFVTANGGTLSCSQAGATEVDIRVDTDAMIQPFSCNDHAGVTPALIGGVNHNVSMALLDAAGNVLSQTPDRRIFVPCDTTVDLGNIELSLTP